MKIWERVWLAPVQKRGQGVIGEIREMVWLLRKGERVEKDEMDEEEPPDPLRLWWDIDARRDSRPLHSKGRLFIHFFQTLKVTSFGSQTYNRLHTACDKVRVTVLPRSWFMLRLLRPSWIRDLWRWDWSSSFSPTTPKKVFSKSKIPSSTQCKRNDFSSSINERIFPDFENPKDE